MNQVNVENVVQGIVIAIIVLCIYKCEINQETEKQQSMRKCLEVSKSPEQCRKAIR